MVTTTAMIIYAGLTLVVFAIGLFLFHWIRERKKAKNNLYADYFPQSYNQHNQYNQQPQPNPYPNQFQQQPVGYGYPQHIAQQPANPIQPIQQPNPDFARYEAMARENEGRIRQLTQQLENQIKSNEGIKQTTKEIKKIIVDEETKAVRLTKEEGEIIGRVDIKLKLPNFADDDLTSKFREKFDETLQRELKAINKRITKEGYEGVEIGYEVE